MTCFRRRSRDRERGNSLVLAMIVMSALATLSGLTVLTVQGGITTTNNDRFHTMATYAAESGAAAAMDFLRTVYDPTTHWSGLLSSSNSAPQAPSGIAGNGIAPGVGNPFSADQQASYRVEILNNPSDPSFAAVSDFDADSRVIIRSTGRGPNLATAVIEWEVARDTADTAVTRFVVLGWRKVY